MMKGFRNKALAMLGVILCVAAVAGCNPSATDDPIPGETVAPTVILTAPLDDDTAVALNSSVIASFSEAMDAATIVAANFTVTNGTTAVPGAVTYDAATMVATFKSTASLAGTTLYTATISTGVKDVAGNALETAYIWTFTTGAAADTLAPTVSLSVPASAATGIALNSTIAISFSEAMLPSSINAVSFTLKQGTTAVAGAVSYLGTTASFDPTVDLGANLVYTATISIAATDLAGNALAAAYETSFTTGAAADTAAPTVSSTIPAASAVGVAVNSNILAVFSEAMTPVTSVMYTVKQGTTAVAGVVTYAGSTATFNPSADLSYSTVYTATVSVAATDLAGNALAAAYVWSFTTGVSPDLAAPTVLSVSPVDTATGVTFNSALTATFSEAMQTLTTATFTLMNGATPVSGTVAYASEVATFTPGAALAADTLYTATITTGAKDIAGNALASAKIWTFTTGSAADSVKPTVTLVSPLDEATDVDVTGNVTATFSEAMATATITTASFTLLEGSNVIPGAVTYSGNVATFNPAADLMTGNVYTATITTAVTDLAGNTLASAYVWTFTAHAIVPIAVNLGTAGNYVILAESAITDSGASDITGDLGLSPQPASFIYGLPLTAAGAWATTAKVTGKLYAADMADPTPANLTTAIGDKLNAYNTIANFEDAVGANLNRASIGGTTFTPGLYTWTANLPIDLPITLEGGTNDVWIFQVNGNLTVAGATKIILAGNAQAKNIFWQVSGYASFLAGAEFTGNVIAAQYITFGNVTKMTGRLMSATAVTVDSTIVVAE